MGRHGHFSYHCSPCHSDDGGGHTVFGKGLYPKPPDLRAAGTQNKSDGELYYTIENGVRLSGMPAFSGTHTVPQTWRLVLFIRHLPQVTAEELNEMKGLDRRVRRIQRISEGLNSRKEHPMKEPDDRSRRCFLKASSMLGLAAAFRPATISEAFADSRVAGQEDTMTPI